jgi:hypothetical protein
MVLQKNIKVFLCIFPTVEVAYETAPKVRVIPTHKVNEQLPLQSG